VVWVDGSFTTWIGTRQKSRLGFVGRGKLFWQIIQKQQKKTIRKQALYAAEGSDWFWWFGEGHSSNQDAIFDRLFREHLCGIYKALNEPVPLIYTNH